MTAYAYRYHSHFGDHGSYKRLGINWVFGTEVCHCQCRAEQAQELWEASADSPWALCLLFMFFLPCSLGKAQSSAQWG